MPTDAALRLEVGRFRQGEHRRRFPTRLSLGELAGDRTSIEVPTEFDLQLGTDLALALAHRIAPDAWEDLVWWVTRPGVPDLHERDNRWIAATAQAAGVLGRTRLPLYVITRAGWLDPVGGGSRRWVRLRL
jgi:hypothetical protein